MTRTAVVPAVRCLFTQANQLAPDRSKQSDGTVASAAHSRQNPTSDHEPDEHGEVFAGDLTDDDAHGVDCRSIAAAIVGARDRRVKYLIHEGRMVRSYPTTRDGRKVPPWEWTDYTGPNGHFHHLHVSVLPDRGDDTRPWPGLSPHATIPPAPKTKPEELDVDEKVLRAIIREEVADVVDDRIALVLRGNATHPDHLQAVRADLAALAAKVERIVKAAKA